MGSTRKSKPAKPVCCGCKDEAAEIVARGLCRPCYSVLRNAVRAGKTTWEAAEAASACKPTTAIEQSRPRFAELFPQLADAPSETK